ncbi:ATP-binding protein [Robertmurraya massiliosenegalensis]|uniref:ATP-binding protein n=1 Tax=Robertmurraya TaxID=2837507 RepID=UPI0039A58EB8
MNPIQIPPHINSAFERISDGIFSFNNTLQLTYMNKKAINFFHLTNDSYLGKHIDEIFQGDLLYTLQKQIAHSLSIQKDTRTEIHLKNDSKQWLEAYIYSSSDGITVLIRDISTRMQVEETIETKHKQLVLLSEAANHLLYKTEPKEILDSLFQELSAYLDLDVYFNYGYDQSRGKLRLMNYQGIPESVAKEIEWLEFGEAVCGCVAQKRERIVAEHIDQSEDPLVQLVKGFDIKAYACHPLLSAGKLIGTLSFGSSKRSKFTEEELDLIFTICNQVAITLEKISLISELKRKKEEAERANQGKTEFLSMMSHEFRTPMNSILGFAQILEADTKEPLTLKQKDKVQKILKSGRHLLTLINDLLNIGKINTEITATKFEATTLKSLIKEIVKMVQPIAETKNIKICNRVCINGKLKVMAETTRLTQVMLNLLSNAVKYTDNNGKIVLTSYIENNYLKIVVADNGIGIPPEEQEKIFTPFYRIFDRNMNIEGTGIGLALVKQYIHEMGGESGVESKPGHGSNFWFTLPISH